MQTVLAQVVKVEAYADGAVNAPSGSAQYSRGLSGDRVRPPWKVAGFDYYVGIPDGTVLVSPTSISDPNVTISGNAVVCGGKDAAATLRENRLHRLLCERSKGWLLFNNDNKLEICVRRKQEPCIYIFSGRKRRAGCD